MANTKTTCITEFINGFNGGTRLNRFKISSTCGRVSTPYHVRSGQIPGAFISAMGLNWFGRTVELPGERIYQPWVITVLDDTNEFEVRSQYEAWQHAIGNKDENTFVNLKNAFSTANNGRGCNFLVSQYRADGDNIEKEFKLFNVWPIQIGPVELDQAKDNQLCSFTVTLGYTHFDYTG